MTDENGTVIAINGATNTIERSVSLGTSEPFHIAVNVSSDTIYVTDLRNSDVAVINGASGTVTTTIALGSSLFGVAVRSDIRNCLRDESGANPRCDLGDRRRQQYDH